MPDLGDDDLKGLRSRLRELGPDGVRSMLASDAFPTGMKMEILKWLAEETSAAREPREHHARHRSTR